ncbi:MAG: tRNA lysidine(34) synthetase TilS, partial [Clostridia bacterium]|nr:tRNA lysidine(34) synthetase TilS [Clostridia bacterium]
DEMQKGETVESAARRLRYGFFKTYAADVGATHLATAHTADDQCETVLLHLIHGAGPKGLCGILPLRTEDGLTIIRPLLNVEKKEILSYCKTHSVPFATDASNEDLTYTRNRIRHVILPEMEKINPNLRQTVCRTAETVQKQQEALTQRAEEFLSTHKNNLPADRLRQLPEGEQAEILRRWFETKGKPLSFEQTAQALALLQKTTGTVEFDRCYRLHLGQNRLTITTPEEPLQEQTVTTETTPLCDGRTLVLTKTLATKENRHGLIPAALPLTLRPRREGDKIGTAGGTKTLKKRLIELKIPQEKRDRLWILCYGETVLWCEAVGVNQKNLPAEGEEGYFISLSEQ